MGRILIEDLWYSHNEAEWRSELDAYWSQVRPKDLDLYKEMDKLNVNMIRSMSAGEWFTFLLEKYFRWKYTAANRYTTTTNYLKKYKEESKIEDLHKIKMRILVIDKRDIKKLLRTMCEVKGLGTAGASGLLSLLYPNHFGTVDQFVVKALKEISHAPELKDIHNINPENITISQGVILIDIMKNKAENLNSFFKTDFWTPRKIDMILWTFRR